MLDSFCVLAIAGFEHEQIAALFVAGFASSTGVVSKFRLEFWKATLRIGDELTEMRISKTNLESPQGPPCSSAPWPAASYLAAF